MPQKMVYQNQNSNKGIYIANIKQNSTVLIKRGSDKAKNKIKFPLRGNQQELECESNFSLTLNN
jgi:hypothetical protein